MKDIIWQSTITEDMVKNMSEHDISLMVNELNDAVVEICNNFEVED
jgi:hypothetical protein